LLHRLPGHSEQLAAVLNQGRSGGKYRYRYPPGERSSYPKRVAVLEAVLMWVENGERNGFPYGVPASARDTGVVNLPPDEIDIEPGDPSPPPGRYVRLSDEQSFAITAAKDRLHVFLADTHTAYEVRWVTNFDDLGQEVRTVERVREKVLEAANLRVRKGAVPLSETFTYTDGDPSGGYLVHGICVLATAATSGSR